MKCYRHFDIVLTMALIFIGFTFVSAESGNFPYTLNLSVYEIPAVFANQFSGITNEATRTSLIQGFYELPFANTGIVERVQAGTDVTLTIPLVATLSPPWMNHPVHSVRIQFREPTGAFLTSTNASGSVEAQLASQCRDVLRQNYHHNTNAPHCYWMAPLQDYGGLARMPFFALPNGANESVPIGTNGWGIAFWVDLDNPALLGGEVIQPPEEPD